VEGKREHSQRLWALLMLELWFRRHIDENTTGQATAG
jgi:asparagine synthase (glutamine-hydrolysing)